MLKPTSEIEPLAGHEKFTVRAGSIIFTVFPWRHSSGDIHWRWKDEKKKDHTRKDKDKARRHAKAMAEGVRDGRKDLNKLPEDQVKALHRMVEAGITLRMADEFLLWRQSAYPTKALSEAAIEFLKVKRKNRGRSIQNVRTLNQRITQLANHFGERPLASITTRELEAFLDINPDPTKPRTNRTRFNHRGSIITFFIWCVKQKYLASADAATAVEKPIIKRKIPETYDASEMLVLLNEVRGRYLGWLASAAFGGFRSDEISPIPGGDKEPLDWSDFKWDRDIIIVRPETDKNGHKRVVPILPALRAWLYPIRKESGPVCDAPPPHKKPNGKDAKGETMRLGEFVGGWRKNGLRHSWISYRAATEGLAKAAMEAGNSEKEAKKSYNDAKSPAEADEWFGLRPPKGFFERENFSELLCNSLK